VALAALALFVLKGGLAEKVLNFLGDVFGGDEADEDALDDDGGDDGGGDDADDDFGLDGDGCLHKN
jgi:hypothetical protein